MAKTLRDVPGPCRHRVEQCPDSRLCAQEAVIRAEQQIDRAGDHNVTDRPRRHAGDRSRNRSQPQTERHIEHRGDDDRVIKEVQHEADVGKVVFEIRRDRSEEGSSKRPEIGEFESPLVRLNESHDDGDCRPVAQIERQDIADGDPTALIEETEVDDPICQQEERQPITQHLVYSRTVRSMRDRHKPPSGHEHQRHRNPMRSSEGMKMHWQCEALSPRSY